MASEVVKPGDTLWSFAQRHLGDGRRWREVQGWRGSPGRMPVGTRLFINEGVPASAPPAMAPAAGGQWSPGAYNALQVGQRGIVNQLVDTFMASIGYPGTVDDMQMRWMMATFVRQQGGLINQAQLRTLMINNVPANVREKNPWAEYGMDEHTYLSHLGRLQAQWFDITGEALGHDVLHRAINESWDMGQLVQHARQTRGDQQPWLRLGQTFNQAEEAFFSAFGHAPADPKTLASWFRFSETAKSLGRAQPLTVQAGRQGGVQRAETEVR